MQTFSRVLRWVDTFTTWSGYFLCLFVVGLIGITLYDIIARQFGLFTMWAFDVEWFIYGFIQMLAMAYAVLKRQHVRIDLVTVRYSPWTQELITAISYAVFIIPLIVFVAIYSWVFAFESMQIGEKTLVAWDAPLWPVKFFIFTGCILMLPQCFVELIRHTYFVVKGKRL